MLYNTMVLDGADLSISSSNYDYFFFFWPFSRRIRFIHRCIHEKAQPFVPSVCFNFTVTKMSFTCLNVKIRESDLIIYNNG